MKCKACHRGIPRLAPKLRDSGYASPKDLICPVCRTFHCFKTGITTKEHEKKVKVDGLKRMGIDSKETYPYY